MRSPCSASMYKGREPCGGSGASRGDCVQIGTIAAVGGFEGMNAPTPTVLWLGGLRGRLAPIRKA